MCVSRFVFVYFSATALLCVWISFVRLIPDGSLCTVSQPAKTGRQSALADKANVFCSSWGQEATVTLKPTDLSYKICYFTPKLDHKYLLSSRSSSCYIKRSLLFVFCILGSELTDYYSHTQQFQAGI